MGAGRGRVSIDATALAAGGEAETETETEGEGEGGQPAGGADGDVAAGEGHDGLPCDGALIVGAAALDIPQPVMRGVAVISRSAGLVGHVLQERERPSARWIWETVEHGVAYDGERP
jgi:citrate synthase